MPLIPHIVVYIEHNSGDHNFYSDIGYKKGNEIHVGLHTFKERDIIYGSTWAECIIPKGSKYYEGTYDNRVSYASDTLKYIKIHKEEWRK